MNPLLYDLLLVALSALLSWFVTHRYYLKSLGNQDKENAQERAALIEALENILANFGKKYHITFA